MSYQSAYIVKCSNCQSFLTNRGNKTTFISDRNKIVYSVDFLSQSMVKSDKPISKFQLCDCKIENVNCSQCLQQVGHHVVQVCTNCQCNDGRFIVLYNAIGFQSNKKLSELSTFYKEHQFKPFSNPENQTAEQDKKQNQESQIKISVDKFDCLICYETLEDPVIILCGHTFCNRCIRRQIDLKQRCPIDNIEMNRQGPYIKNRLISDLIQKNFLKQQIKHSNDVKYQQLEKELEKQQQSQEDQEIEEAQ